MFKDKGFSISFKDFFERANKIQGNKWDFSCDCTDCYWNMYHTNKNNSKMCVSENLSRYKMVPNSKECPSFCFDIED